MMTQRTLDYYGLDPVALTLTLTMTLTLTLTLTGPWHDASSEVATDITSSLSERKPCSLSFEWALGDGPGVGQREQYGQRAQEGQREQEGQME